MDTDLGSPAAVFPPFPSADEATPAVAPPAPVAATPSAVEGQWDGRDVWSDLAWCRCRPANQGA